MSRDEMHLDAMLRHLGAAYYDSLHGRAAKSDVTRAVDQVAQQVGEKPQTHAPAHQPSLDQAHHKVPRHHGRLHSRIRDVMTTEVVTVDRITPFKEIAELLVEHKISGVPVIGLGRTLSASSPKVTSSPRETGERACAGTGQACFGTTLIVPGISGSPPSNS